MTSSARRLLTLAALAAAGGAATAQAVAATGGAKRHATATTQPATKRAKAKTKTKTKARIVKLSGGVAWVPASVLATSQPPLTGAANGNGGASGGTGSGGSGGTGSGGSGGTGSGGSGATGGTPTTPTEPGAPAQQQSLGVTVDERNAYTMVLSRTTLTAGSVVVQLNTIGEDPHNLRIVRTNPGGGSPTDFPDTAKGSPTTKTLTLGSGTYYLYCTLTTPVSHEAAGMHATLRVDP